MAGIGIILSSALVSDGQDQIALAVSDVTERGDSGVRQERLTGGVQRAIGGYATITDYILTAERVTAYQFQWLQDRLGREVFIRFPGGIAQRVIIDGVTRSLRPARTEQYAFGVRVVCVPIEESTD